MKLLSPAGNFDSLRIAVFNGADEVYLGVNDFNARNNIDGFTLDNLESAVDFCHTYGVKVSLAVNILFSDSELFSAFKLVEIAYNLGVDFFIVQDLGLATLIKRFLPKAVLHASTQMGLHNLEGVLAILPYGFKRVVLARETPLSEIKRIKENTDVEIEYFVHGALCVSFSGNCYLSSYVSGASGNRGKCKQLCRLPYTLCRNGKEVKTGYLLSAKDFDLSRRLADLKQAGVDVLKIEGRARRAYYVATATKQYRNLLDGKTADYDALSLAFNRGFTQGYFNGNSKVISKTQNHVGVPVGKVLKVEKRKTYTEVYISSCRKLTPKSTFKFFNGEVESAVLTAYDIKPYQKGYMLTTTQNVQVGDQVRLITDHDLELTALNCSKKANIPIKITLEENKPAQAEFTLYGEPFKIVGDVCQTAQNRPIDKNEVVTCFKKSEYFDCELQIEIIGNVFIVKQQLNELRRRTFLKLKMALTLPYKHDCETTELQFNDYLSSFASATPLKDFEFAYNTSEIENCQSSNVIFCPESYEKQIIFSAKEKCQAEGKNFILNLPPFALKDDVQYLYSLCKELDLTVNANNYYALNFDCPIVIGGGLNVYNNVTASVHGKPFITAEMPCESKVNFPYMTLRHCPYKNLGANCDNCPHTDGYALKMQSGKLLKIRRIKLSDCTFYLTD